MPSCTVLSCAMLRGRKLASAAITYLLGDDEDLEPENSRTALVLAPGKSPSALDVTVVAAQKVILCLLLLRAALWTAWADSVLAIGT